MSAPLVFTDRDQVVITAPRSPGGAPRRHLAVSRDDARLIAERITALLDGES